jgi:putative nucleotidyltransferase with HDIG domain
MPGFPTSARQFLPHALVATFAVVGLPAVAVSFIQTSGSPWLLLLSVLLAMALSVAAATLGSAIWTRRPGSRDLVFGDLMLWGWVRRVLAERRLAGVQGVLGPEAGSAELRQVNRERRRKILQRLAAMLEAKDAYTLGHSRRVTRHSERIARTMGLSREDVAKVRIAASVHDVGKVHTPRHILTKPGGLSADELTVIRRHPVDGARMVAEIGDPEITAMVRSHHERIDGDGYPDGLRGDEIPLGARIISVADTFDAITSGRTYQDARKHRRALDIVSEEAGSQLDPDVVSAFLSYYSGRRAIAWSALSLSGPPRLANLLSGMLNSVGGSVGALSQGLAAIMAAALAGASLAGEPQLASAAGAPTPAGVAVPVRDDAGPRSDQTAREGATLAPRDKRAPGREPGGNGTAPDGPGNDPSGTPAPLPTPAPGPLPNVDPPVDPPVDVRDIELPDVEVPTIEVPQLTVPLSEALPGLGDVELDVELPKL